jgi:hypothetical protein
MILTVFVAPAPEARFDAAYSMEIVHRVEPSTEAAFRHRDLDDVRKFPRYDFCACASFVSGHNLCSLVQIDISFAA